MRKILITVSIIFTIASAVFAEQTVMITEYKEGKKVITHPSGIVSKYAQADLEKQRTELIEQRDRLNEQIIEMDKEIIQVKKTVG